MLRITAWVLLGVLGWDFASCTITCPDGRLCADVTTCCATQQGYACCPYPRAVCCSDRRHCCPSGFRCNLVSQMCEKDNQPWMNVPMMKKAAAMKPSSPDVHFLTEETGLGIEKSEAQKSTFVRCDAQHVCPDGTTCCRHPAGVWFCCGYAFGQCCLDGFHCCPHGYDCDFSYTHCVKQGYATTLRSAASVRATYFPKVEGGMGDVEGKPMTALIQASAEAEIVPCDSQSYCLDGETCCKGSGRWRCCPKPLAQCCRDGIHCCPRGFICDLTSSHCTKQGYATTLKSSASVRANYFPKAEGRVGDVGDKLMTALTQASTSVEIIRCDSKSYCKAGQSCCKGEGGQWSCCPYPLAKCCPDRKHCCEYGYTCDTTSKICTKGFSQVPAKEKDSAQQV